MHRYPADIFVAVSSIHYETVSQSVSFTTSLIKFYYAAAALITHIHTYILIWLYGAYCSDRVTMLAELAPSQQSSTIIAFTDNVI